MIELHLSGAESANGVGTPIDLGPTDRLLRITLLVDTGSVSVVVESAPSTAGPWRRCGDPTSDPTSTTVAYDRWVRLRWTLSGAATFTVTAEPERCYANFDDLHQHGRPSKALRDVSTTERANALGAASAKADGKLRLRYDMPLVAWPIDLREAVAKIAGYDLLSFQGFNPDGSDENVRTRHNDAWKWLGEVAERTIDPVGIVDSSPLVEDGGSVVITHPERGWR